MKSSSSLNCCKLVLLLFEKKNKQFASWFPLFGTITVAILSGYLLLCVISGTSSFFYSQAGNIRQLIKLIDKIYLPLLEEEQQKETKQ